MKKLLLFIFLFLSSHAMEEKPKIKDIFIDSNLEDNVRLFSNKKTDERLKREDYIAYFKTINKEMFDSSKYIIRFLGSVRGNSIEVLKDKDGNNTK